MSRKGKLNAIFSDNSDDMSTKLTENNELDAKLAEDGGVSAYNFGAGLSYDPDTRVVKVDMADEIETGSKKPITADAVAKKIAEMEHDNGKGTIYSTDEIKVGQTIDDKPLYQRVVEFNNVAIKNNPDDENGAKHGIADVDEIFVAEAFYKDTAIPMFGGSFGTAMGNIVVDSNGATLAFQWCANKDSVWMAAPSYINAKTSRTWRIVFRYTKTEKEDEQVEQG